VVGFHRRPPYKEFSNIWFRNNIFREKTGGIGIDARLYTSVIRFRNNLWSKACHEDSRALTGDPSFVNPEAVTPEGYRLKSGSPAIDAGLLLTENQLDLWKGPRPLNARNRVYDIGAHGFGTAGNPHNGLGLETFPFKVTPIKLQFKARPQRKQ
jgi:hypothetical protein